MTVLVLALGVAFLNFHFFALGSQHTYADQSFAASLLAMHQDLNPKLAEKNNTIITTISGSGFIAQAQADDFTGLDSQATQDNSSGQSPMIDDNGIVAPNPDDIKGMVTNATKKVYTTQPGDTLGSIAAANGISADSIRWSNPALTSSQIKPGWNLIIPPLDGVAVTADANTTLPDLAAKYNPERYNSNKQTRDTGAANLLNAIISYNGLDSAEDINDGDFLIIPGGVVATAPTPPAPPKPAPKPKTGSTGKPDITTVTSISGGYDAENHYFPIGYCTYYVATRMKITFGGNAKSWLANARASGYVVGSSPAPHAAVVMTGPKGVMRRYGHVAYVESVNDDGTITVSEMNYDHFNRIDTRTISVNDSTIDGYIYP